MRPRLLLPAALLVAACAVPPAGAPSAPVALDDGSLQAWRAHILPTQAEQAWRTIPWRSSFAEGLADAAADGRPLLA